MAWSIEPIPGGWQMRDEAIGATVSLDGVYPIGRGLEAWVELRVDGQEIPVAAGRQDLTTPGASIPFLRQIPDSSDVAWGPALRELFYAAILADREAAATLDLTTLEPRPLTFILEPLLESGGNTRLIAPGGSGKSLFALAIVLSVTTGSHKFLGLQPDVQGPILYLDWETDGFTHARRLRALCGPVGVPVPGRDLIWYRGEKVPLARSIQAVTRASKKAGAVMLVVDSAKMAAGPSGQSSGEESTLSMFTALREIGLPALILDHKSKEDIHKSRRGGYGSIYMENLARLQWEFTHHNAATKKFVLELTKENNTGAQPSLGFQLVTDSDRTGITAAEFKSINPDTIRTATDETVGDRVDSLFTTSTEPISVGRIAELTGHSQNSVKAYLNRSPVYFNINEGRKGRPGLWRPKEEYLSGPSDDGIQDRMDDEGPVSSFREGPEVY